MSTLPNILPSILPSIVPAKRRVSRKHRRAAVAPPAPPIAHVTNVDRRSQIVLRYTFDVAIIDAGGCGDLRVNDQPPAGTELIDDYTLDALYPDMANGNHWTAHVIDGEPIFADGATLADDGGIVPVWA